MTHPDKKFPQPEESNDPDGGRAERLASEGSSGRKGEAPRRRILRLVGGSNRTSPPTPVASARSERDLEHKECSLAAVGFGGVRRTGSFAVVAVGLRWGHVGRQSGRPRASADEVSADSRFTGRSTTSLGSGRRDASHQSRTTSGAGPAKSYARHGGDRRICQPLGHCLIAEVTDGDPREELGE